MFGQYITDTICDEYKRWTSDKPVLIHAPMGTGKTFFILNVLLPYVHNQNKKMIYFANRIALKEQVAAKIPEEYENTVIPCSYQKFVNLNSKKDEELNNTIMNADYYIVDEAHYFLADSGFNVNIKNCLEKIEYLKKQNPDSIWIYMTATLPYLMLSQQTPKIQIPLIADYQIEPYNKNNFASVRKLLEYKEDTNKDIYAYERWQEQYNRWLAEYKFWQKDIEKNGAFPEAPPRCSLVNMAKDDYYSEIAQRYDRVFDEIKKSFQFYEIEADFSYVDTVFFDGWEDIVSGILQSPEDEKWLIFIESIKDGKILLQQLHDKEFYDVVLIDKEDVQIKELDAQKTFLEIVEKEQFSQKVLITTKLLDNGINLKDTSLKHIVIDAFEETTFLQMLGRKRRVNEAERVYLYLRNTPEGIIRKSFQSRILHFLIFIYDLINCQEYEGSYKDLNEQKFFLSKYVQNGHYKRKYLPFLRLREMHYANAGDNRIKDDNALLINIYEPAGYQKTKLTYDYYQMMAMFERAYNARFEMLADGERMDEKREKSLQDCQFMWLHQQLAWLGLDDPAHEPMDSQNWLLVKFGIRNKAEAEMLAFLEKNADDCPLSREDEKTIKRLFCEWIRTIRPIHKDAKSKGSIAIINRCFKEFNIGYRINSIKKTVNKKQRNWWHIVKD